VLRGESKRPPTIRRRITHIAIAVLAVVIALYLTVALALYLNQGSLVIINDKFSASPGEVGLADTSVCHLTSSDEIRLEAWLSGGPSPFLALYFHGNGRSLPSRTMRITQLRELGFSVLALEYRGFGANPGSPGEQGFARDADAAYAYARKLGFEPRHILLYGESLGTGVAVGLASRHAVAGLILDAPYSSVVDIAADRAWMFPVRPFMKDPFRSDLLIGGLTVPILIIHGEDDETIPIRYGRRLAASGGPNITFVPIPDAGHVVLGEPKAQRHVRDWLSRIPGWQSPASPAPHLRPCAAA